MSMEGPVRTTFRARQVLPLALLLALAGALLPGAALAVPVTDFPGETGSIVVRSGDGQVPTARWNGRDRFDTARLIAADDSAFRAPFETGTVVVARGDLFPDALAGSYLAGDAAAPVLLTQQGLLDPAARSALDELDPDRIVLLGGPAAISLGVQESITATYPAADVERIGGLERYETAALVARAVPAETTTALVASGADYPDALSAGTLSASEGLPLLLTDPAGLPPVTADALTDLGIDRVLLAGGPEAVSEDVRAAIEALGVTVERIGGGARSGTAAAFARLAVERYGYRTDHVQLATGADFPDALAVAPHAGLERAPLLLTNRGGVIDPELAAYLAESVDCLDAVHIAGGQVAVPLAIEDAVRAALTCDVALEPESQTALVGAAASVTATVQAAGGPVAAESVTVTAVPAEGSAALVVPETRTVLTDESGTATVDLTSATPGDVEVSACVTGGICAETVTVTFEVLEPLAGGTGLANPRGVALGSLLVAENGTGGDTCTEVGGLPVCFGLSGAVRVYETATAGVTATESITSLPSLGAAEGASGPSDVAEGPDGTRYVAVGLGAPASVRDAVAADLGEPAIGDLGSLAVIPPGGPTSFIDLATYEETVNPDGSPPASADPDDPAAPFGPADSNPYAVAWDEARGVAVVADAGGNTLVTVDPADPASVEALVVFPEGELSLAPDAGPAVQAAPTSVVVGPDGAYYAGDLLGRVWRIDPDDLPTDLTAAGVPLAGDDELFARGVVSTVDIAFGPDGDLFVLDIFRGAVDRIPVADDGTAGAPVPVVAAGLVFPVGLAVDADGTLYVANCGISALCGEDAGQLVRVEADAEVTGVLSAPAARAADAGAARAALEALGLLR